MHSRWDLDEGERNSRRGHSSHSHSLQPDEDKDERRHSVRLASPPRCHFTNLQRVHVHDACILIGAF